MECIPIAMPDVGIKDGGSMIPATWRSPRTEDYNGSIPPAV